MDAEIEAFREQVRRYIAGEMSPQLDGWRPQGWHCQVAGSVA